VLQQRAKLDMYFAAHAAFYVREMRIKAYAQVLLLSFLLLLCLQTKKLTVLSPASAVI
jgi:hypothetical protein